MIVIEDGDTLKENLAYNNIIPPEHRQQQQVPNDSTVDATGGGGGSSSTSEIQDAIQDHHQAMIDRGLDIRYQERLQKRYDILKRSVRLNVL
jgi:hypothetical protein